MEIYTGDKVIYMNRIFLASSGLYTYIQMSLVSQTLPRWAAKSRGGVRRREPDYIYRLIISIFGSEGKQEV